MNGGRAAPPAQGDRGGAGPGSAPLTQVAAHWRVSGETARAILRRHGVAPVDVGRPRYCWLAIWRIEGEAWVAPWDYPAFRAPLLTPADLVSDDPKGRRARTLRRLLQHGRIPSMQLSPGVRRVRAHVLERVIGHV